MKNVIIDSERMLSFLVDFCKVPTMNSYLGQENDGARFLYDSLRHAAYFETNPEDIFLQPVNHDMLERENMVAFMRAKNGTKDTVVMMGHLDTVDVEVCGEIKEFAFDPAVYTQKLLEIDVKDEVKDDLRSGEWIAGRGISDMKSGLSAQWAIMDHFANHHDDLSVNLLWIRVVDEENNAVGIHQSLKLLRKLENDGYNFLCCIDSEPTITPEDKACGRIYLGTIGMYTPFALAIGKESHVGEYYEGLSASLMGFHLGIKVENNEDFTDIFKGNAYPPICVLRTMDFRKTYSVTVPNRFGMYFDYLFVNRSPEETLGLLEKLAQKSISDSLAQISHKAKHTPTLASRKGRVYYFSEIAQMAVNKTGQSVNSLLKEFLTDKDLSEVQDNYLMFVNYLADVLQLEGPAFIIGLLPPYCPSRVNKRESREELAIEKTVSDLMAEFNGKGVRIELSEVYEGISDLSELGFQGDTNDIDVITSNIIGLGVSFEYNFTEMKELNIPVVNIGPIGKDAHKQTERLYLPYFKNELPELLLKFIDGLCANTK
jgi:arginine utilization protein RocB